MKALILFALTCFVRLASGGEIQDYYWKIAHTNMLDPKLLMSGPRLVTTNHGITEIAIERTDCVWKTCPTYTFILRSDGTCSYKGVANVDYVGDKAGTINRALFHELANFIVTSAYWSMPDTYTCGVTDGTTVFTSFAFNDRRKVFSDYSNSAPTKIWALEQ